MNKLSLVALAFVFASGTAVLADDKPSADEAAKIKEAVAAWGCEGGEYEKETEAPASSKPRTLSARPAITISVWTRTSRFSPSPRTKHPAGALPRIAGGAAFEPAPQCITTLFMISTEKAQTPEL